MLVYDFVIVGGGFDGVAGLKWHDDGKHPTPAVILVARCAKGMDCGSASCRLSLAHVSFWTPGEPGVPAQSQRYEKRDDELLRDPKTGGLRGRTTYAIGGLLDPRNRGALAHEPVGAVPPLTYAGARGVVDADPYTAPLTVIDGALRPLCPVCRRPNGTLHTPSCPLRSTT